MDYVYRDDGNWKIQGMEPDGTGSGLPVFVFLQGTGDDFEASSNLQFVEAMARRGFIAAEVDYPNAMTEYEWNIVQDQWGDGGMKKFLNAVKKKAEKIFPMALDELCSRRRADCSNGVAVAGFSQGGYITLYSVQHDPRITAIMPLGVKCLHKDPDLPDADFDDEFLSQYVAASNRLIINGGDEGYKPECLSKMSGMAECGAGRVEDCRRADGSGFLFVARAQDNFYANCDPNEKDTEMKCDYMEGTEAWALPAATDWLAQRAAPSSAVIPAVVGQTCRRSSRDTDINDTPSCVNWSVLPGFWAGFAVLLVLFCCCPCCIALCFFRKVLCFAPKNQNLDPYPVAPAQQYYYQPEEPAYFPPPAVSPEPMMMMEPHFVEQHVELTEAPLSPEEFHARYGPSPYVQVPEPVYAPQPTYQPQRLEPPPSQNFYTPPPLEFYPPPPTASQPPLAPFQLPVFQAVPEPTHYYPGPPLMELQSPGVAPYAPLQMQQRDYAPPPTGGSMAPVYRPRGGSMQPVYGT